MQQTRLQKTPDKQYPYVYHNLLLIEMGLILKKEQPLDIDYDTTNRRIVILETINGME